MSSPVPAPAQRALPASPIAETRHRPLPVPAVRLVGGPLGAWQERNGTATIPHCIKQLEASGVLDNFRRVVGESTAEHRGFVFADSDLYKVIEAVAWEIARSGTHTFDAWLDDVVALVARVQEPSGYVHTWIQGVAPEKKFAELEWTHEMYVAGHLVQAAIALARATGRTDLLDVARRFADLLDERFGPEGVDGICGHPEIESALVELFRTTGERRYLDLASRMVDLRGHGLLTVGSLGAHYFQDHRPVRESTAAVGHAVRQLYLNAGVTDVFVETGDASLRRAMDAQWSSAHDRKMYLSGAFGSRHRDEAFGDDYELPSDRAYAETCATIADLLWTWRMLLADGAGGAARYAATIEREVHNALAAAVDASGTRFFYANPLQLRHDHHSEENAPRERASWYPCACCPPNIARTVAQLSAYVATVTDGALWLHQLAAAEIDLPAELGAGTVRVVTAYPADGRVEIHVDAEVVSSGAALRVRIPEWSSRSSVLGPDGSHEREDDGYARVPLTPGATYVLELDLTPRLTTAHHRVDALRGAAAVERGPIVYCVEHADLAHEIDVDDIALVPDAPITVREGGTLAVRCRVIRAADQLYGADPSAEVGDEHAVIAIPFSTWGNRAPGPMRVWLPVSPR
ncbi:glycoside hydrolase family 127 protein [Xylanimonas sp. McL0601]|uniref:glycoside hydrolase family 127 protein n=1 Tax=Xylanimonas sp. McL0601 TaxID=3414739 RepID=UPI003CF4F1E8